MLSLLPVPNRFNDAVIAPIKVSKNRIFIDVLVNQTSRATLLLDTGATCSLLTPEFAHGIGIHPEKDQKKYSVNLLGRKQVRMPFVFLEEIKIDRAAVRNLYIGIFPAFPDQPHIKGILGADFLMHYKITIDHDKSALIIEM